MSKYNKLTTEQIEKIEEILNSGGTKVKAANDVLGSKTKESTIRNAIGRGDIKLSSESVEEEDGLTEEILDKLCSNQDWDLANLAKRLRTAQKTNNQLRKVQRDIFDGEEELVSLSEVINNAVSTINTKPRNSLKYLPSIKGEPATLEVLLSDYQIGKVTRYYNTKTAIKGMALYGQRILEEVSSRQEKYPLERIVVAMIGDIVEDHTKHGVGSAISTDTGLSEQMHNAITSIWESIIEPLSLLNIEMEVICVVGNHGSSTHKGMGSFKEGRYSYDFVVHKTLETLCRVSKYNHVTFNIPDGTFATTDFYGKHAIYEHGYHNNISEKGMVDQMRKRGSQLQIHPTYWRQGDKHHHTCFGQGEQVLNGAFFGTDQEGLEYSGILGFSGIPSQTIMFHTKEDSVGHATVKDIINIQVFVEE